MHPQASAPPSGKFTLTPYSAYNQFHVQGSPPSMADVMSQNATGEHQRQPMQNTSLGLNEHYLNSNSLMMGQTAAVP